MPSRLRVEPNVEDAAGSASPSAAAPLLGLGMFLQLLVLAVLARNEVAPPVLVAWLVACGVCSVVRVWALAVTDEGDSPLDLAMAVLYGGAVLAYWLWLAPTEDAVAVGIVLVCLTLWWASATAVMANSPISFILLSALLTAGPLLAAATRGSSYGVAVWLVVPLGASILVTFGERHVAHLARTRTHTDIRSLATEVQLAFDAARDGVLVTRAGRVNRTNAAARGLLRRDDDDLRGRFLGEVLGARGEHLVPQGPPEPLPLTRADGSHRILEVAGREGGDGELVVWTLRDVTDEVAQLSELLELVHRDELTGVANRRVVGERLAAAVGRGEHTAVLAIDVDEFKSINDRLGHAAGDRVLLEVVARLRQATGDHGLVARVGGDEFAVVLTGAAVVHRHRIAERIIDLAAAPLPVAAAPVLVTVSIGVAASADGPFRTVGELLDAADRAMYRAKRDGRAGWRDAADP